MKLFKGLDVLVVYMNHREFNSFNPPEVDYIDEVTPIIFSHTSSGGSTPIFFLMELDSQLISIGVRLGGSDSFNLEDGSVDIYQYCDVCERRGSVNSMRLTAINPEDFDLDSFKENDFELNPGSFEQSDLSSIFICSSCYDPLTDCIREWADNHRSEISSHIL